MTPSFFASRALALSLVVLAGCGPSGRLPVWGKVTYNGEPVDHGTITFLAAGGQAVNAGGEIRDGKYLIDSERGPALGKYRVEIYWNKKTGKMVPTPGDRDVKMPETRQVLPPKYNKQSQLTADVTPSGNTRDFDLKP